MEARRSWPQGQVKSQVIDGSGKPIARHTMAPSSLCIWTEAVRLPSWSERTPIRSIWLFLARAVSLRNPRFGGLFNGLRRLLRKGIFRAPGVVTAGSADRRRWVEGHAEGRIVHSASLPLVLIFCKRLSSGRPLATSSRGAERRGDAGIVGRPTISGWPRRPSASSR